MRIALYGECLGKELLTALRASRFVSVYKDSWLSMALGLAMMVLDVRKNLKPTQYYLLNKLCY